MHRIQRETRNSCDQTIHGNDDDDDPQKTRNATPKTEKRRNNQKTHSKKKHNNPFKQKWVAAKKNNMTGY